MNTLGTGVNNDAVQHAQVENVKNYLVRVLLAAKTDTTDKHVLCPVRKTV